MAYYNPPQVMPPTIAPSIRPNQQPMPPVSDVAMKQRHPNVPPGIRPPGPVMQNQNPQPGISPRVMALMGRPPGAMPAPGARPVQPGQMFQNAGQMMNSKPMQAQPTPEQMSMAQRLTSAQNQVMPSKPMQLPTHEAGPRPMPPTVDPRRRYPPRIAAFMPPSTIGLPPPESM